MKRKKIAEVMIGVAVMLALILTGRFAVEVKTEAAAVTNVMATLTVTSPLDDGSAGTLRWAIANAEANDTIEFALTYPATITLTSGELFINKNLTIQGPGARSLKVSGNHSSRVFEVSVGTTVTLSGFTIADGYSFGPNGGGISNAGNLTVTDCTISGNQARPFSTSGGGIFNDQGTLTITGSTFFENETEGVGGGIYNQGGKATLTNCTFAANVGPGGGGIAQRFGQLTLTNCTFSDNESGIVNDVGSVTMNNTIV